MSDKLIRPGLAAAMTAGRALLAAGWRYDATSPMADYTTIRTLLHPSGREIHARTVDGGEQTALTMTGLTLEQVAGAVAGAGLAVAGPQTREMKARYLTAEHHIVLDVAETISTVQRTGDTVTAVLHDGTSVEYDVEEGVTVVDNDTPAAGLHQRLAAELHRIADAIVTNRLPLNERLSASLNLGVLSSRADLDEWAAHLGSTIKVDGSGIPHTQAKILLGDTAYGPDLTVGVQTHRDSRSEVERLREENETLRAQLAEGGTR